jgi:hypothetical protein
LNCVGLFAVIATELVRWKLSKRPSWNSSALFAPFFATLSPEICARARPPIPRIITDTTSTTTDRRVFMGPPRLTVRGP